MDRCNDVLDLAETVNHFRCLDGIELGGQRGHMLSANVRQIFSEFSEALAKFHDGRVDILNIEVSSEQFDQSYISFRMCIKALERRLAVVLEQSLHGEMSLPDKLQVLSMFQGILSRDYIQQYMELKFRDVLLEVEVEVQLIQRTFEAEKDARSRHSTLPPLSSNLLWINALSTRLDEAFGTLRNFPAKLESIGELCRDVLRLAQTIQAKLNDFEAATNASWKTKAVVLTRNILDAKLLVCEHGTGELDLPQFTLNLDPSLRELFRETKYIPQLGGSLPETTRPVLNVTDRVLTAARSLELILRGYNQLRTELTPAEHTLLSEKFAAMKHLLLRGVRELTWTHHGVDDFLTDATYLVWKDVHPRMVQVGFAINFHMFVF